MTFSPAAVRRLTRLLAFMARYHGSGLVRDLTPEDTRRASSIIKT